MSGSPLLATATMPIPAGVSAAFLDVLVANFSRDGAPVPVTLYRPADQCWLEAQGHDVAGLVVGLARYGRELVADLEVPGCIGRRLEEFIAMPRAAMGGYGPYLARLELVRLEGTGRLNAARLAEALAAAN